MRALSADFLHDLEGGLLQPMLDRVRQDNTLMISIRDGYINIYYRGGNILRLEEKKKGLYKAFFDLRYIKTSVKTPELPESLKTSEHVKEWIDAFPALKQTMDVSFSINSKPEREFQQLVARENNCSTISNESEYFISDIEASDSGLGARFDMLAIRWPAAQRRNRSKCRAAFIEMKYGDGALAGTAGLIKHLEDIGELIADGIRYKDILLTMETQFNQLDRLGLLKFNHSGKGTGVRIEAKEKPEVIFILANHNPRSTKLGSILNSKAIQSYGRSELFDLRFFVSNFAGYGLHSDCMFTLDKLLTLL